MICKLDKVNKNILAHKLINKTNDKLWLAIVKYMDMARITLQIGEERSEQIQVTHGVKQGGNCSPLFFKLYIDDMISEIIRSPFGHKIFDTNVGALCFADDTALIAKNVNDMQKLIRIVERYCAINFITINASKTEFMVIGSTSQRQKFKETKIKINRQEINQVSKFKYLGNIVN